MSSAPSSQEAFLNLGLQERPTCQHHWVIERPAGRVSKGACRLCGEEREFQNYVEGSPWGGESSLESLGGGSQLPSGIDVARRQDDSKFDEDA